MEVVDVLRCGTPSKLDEAARLHTTTVGSSVKEELSRQMFGVLLTSIMRQTQDPPPGFIKPGALLWDVQVRHARGVHKNRMIVQQCYILTSRVPDFVAGMGRSANGVASEFMCVESRFHKATRVITADTGREFRRYCCEYGPQDHSGIVRELTIEDMPKSRRKVTVLDSEVVVPKPKRRGRPKKVAADGASKPTLRRKIAEPRKKAPQKKTPVNRSGPVAGIKVSGSCSAKAGRRKRLPKKDPILGLTTCLFDLNLLPEADDMQCSTKFLVTEVKKKRAPRKPRGKKITPTQPDEADLPKMDQSSRLATCLLDLNSHPEGDKVQCSAECYITDVKKKRAPRKPRGKKITPTQADKADLPKMDQSSRLATCLLDLNSHPEGDKVQCSTECLVSESSFNSTAEIVSEPILMATSDWSFDLNLPADGYDNPPPALNMACISEPLIEGQDGTTLPPATADVGDKPSRKKRESRKTWGGSMKKGCLAQFTTKQLYLLPQVTEVCIIHRRHVNRNGLVVHGAIKEGDRSAFSGHISEEMKEFVRNCVRNRMSVPQIMSKHLQKLFEWEQEGRTLTRDVFIDEKDIHNIAGKMACETYMLHQNDAESVRMWVQQNPESCFYYSETGARVPGALTGDNMPFTIGIQTPWQKEQMLQHGHRKAVSVDATFGTNEKKFPLYTMMVFDDWNNGVPVAYILTSKCAQEDLTPWMRALNERLTAERPEWQPNAFVVDCAQGEINSLMEIWPDTAIFLCLWHVRRAWQKQTCQKIADHIVRAAVLKELGLIMYDRNGPSGEEATTWAAKRIDELKKTYPSVEEFWLYMESQWLPKVHMWVVGFRNLCYAGQDTNAAIENYHGYMKSVLKAERSRMSGRRVDWCIYALTGDVIHHYRYSAMRKRHGFVNNKKKRDTVVAALLKARDIPDSDVTLPIMLGGTAVVTSTSQRHVRYIVHNPESDFGFCTCMHSQRGNICKHQVKVLRMMHPQLAEGKIARFCGTLHGTAQGGLAHLLTPPMVNSPVQVSSPSMASIPVKQTPVEQTPVKASVDLDKLLIEQAQDILKFAVENPRLKEHLHSEFNRAMGKLKTVLANERSGHVLGISGTPMLHQVQDGLGMKLGRLKDALERRGKSFTSRRLRMGEQ